MQDEPREVTMFCPRCSRPIVRRQRGAGGLVRVVGTVVGLDAPEVAGPGYSCALSDAEWDDLADAASEILHEEV